MTDMAREAIRDENRVTMTMLDIVRQTVAAFCVEFVNHPYLCYTEHGQHALFFTRLYTAMYVII